MVMEDLSNAEAKLLESATDARFGDNAFTIIVVFSYIAAAAAFAVGAYKFYNDFMVNNLTLGQTINDCRESFEVFVLFIIIAGGLRFQQVAYSLVRKLYA